MGKSEVSTSEVKWNEDLSNQVCIIISRHIVYIRFPAYMALSFITFCHILLVLFYIVVFKFCLLPFNFERYVF